MILHVSEVGRESFEGLGRAINFSSTFDIQTSLIGCEADRQNHNM